MEQYPVTAHVPNFDRFSDRMYLSRIPKMRGEYSKRTLNNSFASRAEVDTALKRIRINIWFPLSFELGKIGIFGVTFISGGSRPSDGGGGGGAVSKKKRKNRGALPSRPLSWIRHCSLPLAEGPRKVTPCEGIQDNLGFWIPCRGCSIPGTGFQSFSGQLGFRIPML